MLLEHRGASPQVHPSAYVAPTAVVCGDVHLGPHCRVLFGAILTADSGRVELGEQCIIMENAVLRGTARDPLRLGDHVLAGPRAYLSGCATEDNVFLATGTTVFNGARIGTRSEIRVNAVVHLRTRFRRTRRYRSAGSRSVTPPGYSRPSSMSGYGRCSGSWTSPATCSACPGPPRARRPCPN